MIEEKRRNVGQDERIARLEAFVFKKSAHDVDILAENGSCSVKYEAPIPKHKSCDMDKLVYEDIDMQLLATYDVYMVLFLLFYVIFWVLIFDYKSICYLFYRVNLWH